MKNCSAITRAQRFFTRAFRMRHQAHHVAAAAANAGDVVTRAINICLVSDAAGVVRVPKYDAIFSLKLIESCVIADVVSFGLSYRNLQNLAALKFMSEGRVRAFHADVDVLADEMQFVIPNQSAG